MKNIFPFFITLFLTACSSSTMQEEKAHIIEREMLANGKLLISYVFKTGNTTVVDKTETENTILPHDSVIVIFPRHYTGKKQIKLP